MSGPAFTAQGGRVLFEGRPLNDFRAIVTKARLVDHAMDLKVPVRAASHYWAFARQLRDAMDAARDQRANPIKRSA